MQLALMSGMSRFVHLRNLAIATPFAIGVALACRAASPSEAPPLAPRPEPVQPNANPVPSVPDPGLPGPPGPAPTHVDAQPASPLPITPPPEAKPTSIRELRTELHAGAYPAQNPVPVDGGGYNPIPQDSPPALDAGLENPPDAVPIDASRQSTDAF